MAYQAKIGSFVGRCRDCQFEQSVSSVETKHASPPRCNACGGILDLSQAKLSLDAKEQPKRRQEPHLKRRRTWK